MKKKCRMFRRGHVFWAQDHETGKQETLDPAPLVTPPAGFEVGYVPIVIRQARQ